jgi:DNA-binding MarR family transcriptional regulator
MTEEFNVRHFFGSVDRLRERIICSHPFKFDVDILSLTMSQQRLLRELALQTGPESEGISLKHLADELNLSSSAVSVMVEMLVQKKVLERRSSEVDRRAVSICLSEEGKAKRKKIHDFFVSMTEELMADIAVEDLDAFCRVTAQFRTKLNAKKQLLLTQLRDKNTKK